MKGKLMRKLLALTASAVLAFSTVPVQAEDVSSSSTESSSSSSGYYSAYLENVQYHQDKARDMLAFVNDFRTSGNAWYWNAGNTTKTENIVKSSLAFDYGLEEIAMQRAAEIAASFSHTRPNGTPCFSCLSKNGGMSYGENIAAGLSSVSATFDMWKEESVGYEGQGHRRNMLGDYQAIGIACVDVGGIYFWVQEFGPSTGTAAVPACLDKKSVSMEVSESRIDSGYFNTAESM
ncbi:MAG: CAP domain-containing protein, partial [Solobacterium sp.]|nr:CAP domain-containing protein [Solobacterium sp.]